MTHTVVVTGLPAWLDPARFLGEGAWRVTTTSSPVVSGQPAHDDSWGGGGPAPLRNASPGASPRVTALTCALDTRAAADLAARLRNVGIGGQVVEVTFTPELPRAAVRTARTEDARRRREATPGFTRPGARLDEVGRFSLTPESLALRMGTLAARVLAEAETGRGPHTEAQRHRETQGRRQDHEGVWRGRVVDACCGAGGNAIGFARAGLEVTAWELDATRAALARANAGVYGLGARVRVHAGDAVTGLAEAAGRGALAGALVFVDPPWGGTEYDRARILPGDLPPLPAILALLAGLPAAQAPTGVWLKLPPSCAVDELGPGWQVEAWFGDGAGDHQRVKFLLARQGVGGIRSATQTPGAL